MRASVTAALDVAKTGKLPPWTKFGPIRLVISMAGVAAFFYFLLLPVGSDVLRDHRLAGSWRPAYDMQATDGHCKSYWFLLTDCTAKIISVAEPDQPAVASHFIMSFASGDGERLVPVRSTVDPSVVTIGYAAETKLWNRTLSFVAWTFFAGLAFYSMARLLMSGRYKGGAAHRELMAGLTELTARAGSAPDNPPAAA